MSITDGQNGTQGSAGGPMAGRALSRAGTGGVRSSGGMPGNDRDERLPPTVGQLVWRFVRRNSVLAFAVSVVLHIISLMILGVISMPYGILGGGTGPSGEIGVAIVSEGELDQLQSGALELNAPSVPEMVGADPEAKDLLVADMGDEMASAIGDVSDVGTISGGGDIGGIGGGLGGGGAGGGGASFFGVESRGNRFAFIIDVSGSMGEGEKMPSMRRELIDSIAGMVETAQFLVVPYSDKANPLGGATEWRTSSVSGKKWAKLQINALSPDGGTVPLPAFEVVLNIRPRPDAVYFMTDGEFDPNLVQLIKDMNKAAKIPIHCLCLVSQGSEEHMKLIAKESGGTYHFVP